MTIDHLVYGVPDLELAVGDLEARFEVRAEAGGRHVGIGTHNAIVALGPRTYLEIIAPDPQQPSPPNPRPFGLDEVTSARLVGWAVGCDDIDATIARARGGGFDPGDAVEMTRIQPTGGVLRWRVTLNALGDGAVPFLISWGDTQHPALSAPQGPALEAFEIEHPEPDSLRATLRALGADIDADVRRARSVALIAHIRIRTGTVELR